MEVEKKVKNIEKYHGRKVKKYGKIPCQLHMHLMLLIITHYEPGYPSYLLDFTNYLNIKVLPVASYYADYIKLCKKL